MSQNLQNNKTHTNILPKNKPNKQTKTEKKRIIGQFSGSPAGSPHAVA